MIIFELVLSLIFCSVYIRTDKIEYVILATFLVFIFMADIIDWCIKRKEVKEIMINYPEDWPLQQRLEWVQRKIIVMSIAYYEFDVSLMTDYSFDELSYELVRLQDEWRNGPNDIYETKYGYVTADFDGSTGAHLYSRLTGLDKEHLTEVAEMLINTKNGHN